MITATNAPHLANVRTAAVATEAWHIDAFQGMASIEKHLSFTGCVRRYWDSNTRGNEPHAENALLPMPVADAGMATPASELHL